MKSLKTLIEKLRSLSKETLNKEQLQFIDLLNSRPIAWNKLNEHLKNLKLYNNTELEFDKNLSFKSEEWEKIINVSNKALSIGTEDENNPEPDTEFKNVRYYKVELDRENKEICFKLRKLKKPFPNDVHNFIQDVEKVQNTIKALYTVDKEVLEYLTRLKGIAEVGGTSTYNALGISYLELLKKEIIINKGNRLKTEYLKQYGRSVLCILAVCYAISLFMTHNKAKVVEYLLVDSIYFVNGLYVIMGTAVGAWLIFAIQKKKVSFQDLRILKENKVASLVRLVVIELIAIAFFFMFLTEFINFKVGDQFDTANLMKEGFRNTAFLLGLFFGLSESTLGAKLTTKVESFIAEL